jgi:hypothetical protein
MTKKTPGISHLEIYKHLSKSNCRECGVPTCLAFATAVIHGEKKITDCPYLNREVIQELDKRIVKRDDQREMDVLTEALKKEVLKTDFRSVAGGIGAEYIDGRLRVRCLGKEFLVDNEGNVESVVHINKWVTVPLLKYITMGGNAPLSGTWVSFEELKKASTVTQYFNRRCEEPLRQLAESHTDIFFDLLTIFGATSVEGFPADYSRIIYPLPKLPFLILYWRPEDQFESKLKLLLDSTADTYLDIEFIIALGRGIVEMFKRILSRHEELLPTLLSL